MAAYGELANNLQCESKKLPLLIFFWRFFQTVGVFSPHFTCLLYLPIYAGLQIFIQLSATLTKLCATTIICSKRPPSVETHAGWSYLILPNFVTVRNNWIKICSQAYIGTCNRCVKFGPKIPNCLVKMSENASNSIRFGRWWTFWKCGMNWVVALNMA